MVSRVWSNYIFDVGLGFRDYKYNLQHIRYIYSDIIMTEDECKLIFENVLNYNFWLTVEAMEHAGSFSKPYRVRIFVTFIQFAQMQPLRRRISAQCFHLPALLLIGQRVLRA